MDQLGLVEPVDRLAQCVVVTVADAADGWHEAGLGEALGVDDREILHTAIGVVHEAAPPRDGFAIVDGLLKRIEHEARVRRFADTTTDNASGVGVDDEGHVDEAGPCGDVGEVRYPQCVRPWRLELPVDVIERARLGLVGDIVRTCAPRMTPRRPGLRISRATVQRATLMPSRINCRQTFRTP